MDIENVTSAHYKFSQKKSKKVELTEGKKIIWE